MRFNDRFIVVEYSSGYAVRDRKSGEERWMSDGVNALHTRTGKAMRPGSEHFRKAWQRSLNANESETAEAYGFGGAARGAVEAGPPAGGKGEHRLNQTQDKR